MGHPLPQVALLRPHGKALPRRSVANGRHRDNRVGGAAAVRVVGVREQPGVVASGDGGHPALPEGRLKLVFRTATHRVHLVDEQHAETSHAQALHLDGDAENLVSSRG